MPARSNDPAPFSRPGLRLASVDILRGLTMALMIFVNELADVKRLPPWTYHMPANVDAMSYVDMVFPMFLFVMGLSLPVAINGRLARGSSVSQLWLHIVVRSVSLMVLGLILANAELGSAPLMHMAPSTWALLALAGAVLFLNVYPRSVPSLVPRISKIVGLLLLSAMLLIFRRTDNHGAVHWLDFGYWEILGIIGWTYLAVCILYVPTRKLRAAPLFWLASLVVFNICCAAHIFSAPDSLPFYLWPWSNGAFAVLVMAGVLTSQIVITGEWAVELWAKLKLATFFALVLLALGGITAPLGISKIRATPTWCLVTAGVGVLLFILLYWICDVRRKIAWALFVQPAGANTLLTYLVPDFFFFAGALAWLPAAWTVGLPGVLQSFAFTALMLVVAALLTRWRVRLQL